MKRKRTIASLKLSAAKSEEGVQVFMIKKCKRVVGFSELPQDLIMLIEGKLDFYVDKLRVRCVCKLWHLALPKLSKPLIPWLLHTDGYGIEHSFKIFDPLGKKSYSIHLPKARREVFKGSCFGWLVTYQVYPEIYLLHPFTQSKIQLPSRTTVPSVEPDDEEKKFEDPYGYKDYNAPSKIVLSSNPRSDGWTAVAICGEENSTLAFCHQGDNTWRLLRHLNARINDIIFHKGKLHALTLRGELLVFDQISNCANYNTIVFSSYDGSKSCHKYLVETCDGLMVLERVFDDDDDALFTTKGFNIFEIDLVRSCLVMVTELRDKVIFVSSNSATLFSSHEVEGNCIHFTDNVVNYDDGRYEGDDYHPTEHRLGSEECAGADIGVFNLKDNSVKPLPGYKHDSNFFWPPPVWLTMNFL